MTKVLIVVLSGKGLSGDESFDSCVKCIGLVRCDKDYVVVLVMSFREFFSKVYLEFNCFYYLFKSKKLSSFL